MLPTLDQARADEFLHRHMQLTYLAALVVPVTLAAVFVAASLAPKPSTWWAVACATAGSGVLATVAAVLAWHTVRLSLFAFRREVS